MCAFRLRLMALAAPALLGACMLQAWWSGRERYVALLLEDGPIEQWTVVFLLLGAVVATLLARRFARSGPPRTTVALCGVAVVLLVGAGDEISWGQRGLGFRTPAPWRALSDQPDVSLHNVAQHQLHLKTKHVVALGLGIATIASLIGLIAPFPLLPGADEPSVTAPEDGPPPIRWWPSMSLSVISIAGAVASMDYPTGWEEEAGELLASMWLAFWLLGVFGGTDRCGHTHSVTTGWILRVRRVWTRMKEWAVSIPIFRNRLPAPRGDHGGEMAVIAMVIVLGLAATIANGRLPIMRNSLVYARIATHIADHAWRFWEVCPQPDLAYNKACGFPLISSSLVNAWGPSAGLRVASFVGTLAFLLASWSALYRFGSVFGVERRWYPAALLILGLNPLVLYQFWSAYPDTLFSALCLMSLVSLDHVLFREEPHRSRWAIVFFATTCSTVLIKHQGLMLIACQSLFFLVTVVASRRAGDAPYGGDGTRYYLGATSVLLSLLLLTMLIGDRLNIEDSFEGHASGMFKDPLGGLAQLGLWIIVSLHVFLLPAVAGAAKLARENSPRLAAIAATATSWVMLNAASASGVYNMRYYLWMAPFLTLAAVRGFVSLERTRAANVLFVAASVGFVFTAGYNFAPLWTSYGSDVDRVLRRISRTDNLRMPQHLQLATTLSRINQAVPARGTLVFAADYYYASDASHHIYDRDGLIRRDITVEYVKRYRDVKTKEHKYWLYNGMLVRGRKPLDLPGAAVAHSLGGDLFRVTRP